MIKKLLSKIHNMFPRLFKKSTNLIDKNSFYQNFGQFLCLKSNQRLSSWVFDCIDIWGKHFSKVDFKLYEILDDGSVQVVTSHPIVELLRRPNNFQTLWEIKYRIAQHFSLYGNSYLVKLRDGLNIPRQIIQVDPKRIEPKASESEFISHYEYFTGKNYIRIDKKDVIHLRYPDPDNLIKGRPIIANIIDQSEVDLLQTAYQKKFYREGGFLGLTFTTNQLMSEESFERAKKQVQEQYGGYDNAFRIALFEQGLQPIKASYSLKDMDIRTQRELTRDEIAAAFQVSPFLLGMGEFINRATAQTALFHFLNGVIEPLMHYISEVFTKDLAQLDFSYNYLIKHDISSLRDVEKDLEYYRSGIELGWLTKDEVRKMENLEPLN